MKVSGKPAKRQKHTPQRTCIGCRSVLPKRELIRLVRQPDGVVIDPTSKLAGRGAYIHGQRSCWEKGLKGTLAQALKVSLTTANLDHLRTFMQTLPEDDPVEGVD
jgi:predicted RNA-binding protein YlxR (DUF448 family)